MGGFLSDGLFVSDDWVTLLKVALGILLDKIFKADLEMEDYDLVKWNAIAFYLMEQHVS